jgi:hypothetical protein
MSTPLRHHVVDTLARSAPSAACLRRVYVDPIARVHRSRSDGRRETVARLVGEISHQNRTTEICRATEATA